MTTIQRFNFLKVAGREIEGILMKIEPSYDTRYSYEIWFPYSLEYINQIREGRFLAVKNFATKGAEEHWSILEVTYIEPLHYALHNITHSHYPQFVETAAKNASRDWIEQVDFPQFPTTRIVVRAIPTNLEVMDNGTEYILQEEANIPMLGKEVYILDNETTEEIINKGMNRGYIEAGTWIIGNVKIKINVEELLRKHFGIFGFTGAGKSNLLSTLIRKIMEYSDKENEPIKLVIWDLMSEYYGLLLDILCKYDSYLIAIGENTFPDSVMHYLKTGSSDLLEQASKDLVKTMVFPKEIENLDKFPENIIEITKKLLTCNKVRILRKEYHVTELMYHPKYNPWKNRKRGSSPHRTITRIVKDITRGYYENNDLVTPEVASEMLNRLERLLKKPEYRDYAEDFEELKKILKKLSQASPLASYEITPKCIIDKLNNSDSSTLLIFISHDPDEIRDTAWEIGMKLYENRRKKGIISPTVSFIFDEADEFIPQDIDKRNDSYKHSSEIAMTIARRGRKFGIGLGIATQRIRYLNTSILAQPHTYFVSKLPRKTDREAVAEAFGLGLDMFNQTFKFKKGDWLVISHDALGMEAVPIPVHFENANTRIIEFLENSTNTCCKVKEEKPEEDDQK